MDAAPIRFIEGCFKYERADSITNSHRRAHHMFFTFDHARTCDQGQRRLVSELNLAVSLANSNRQAHCTCEYSGMSAADSLSAASIFRFWYSSAAFRNEVNSGCGSSGLDLNSGWNWHPRYQG